MRQALHGLDRLRFGGAESVALNYARLMSEWGVVSTLTGKPDSPEFEQSVDEYCAVRHGFTLRRIRESDCIFIHTNRNLLRLLLLRPFYRRRNKRIVYIRHLPCSERKFRWLSRIINRVCTRFIRITPVTKSLVEKYIRIPVSFLPNFYLPRYSENQHPEIRREIRSEWRIPEEKKVVLFTGVLRRGKGLEDFLALAERFSGDENYLFVAAGDGEEAGKMEAYPHANLLWVGWQSDVERWLIASDVYCFLSRNEMMPMALIEALTLGKPVAALTSPVNDFLLDGQTFPDTDSIGTAIRTEHIPVVPLVYGREYAENELKRMFRKKILHIQVLPKLTGVQRISLEILWSLPVDEYDKTVLFGQPENAFTEACFRHFRETGTRIIRSDSLRREIGRHDCRAFREIYRLCRSESYDIVHTHSTKPGILGRIAARLAGVPLVVHTVHGVAFHRHTPFPKRIVYYFIEFFASFFSHRMTQVSGYYRRFYPVFKRKTSVIPNGIRFPETFPAQSDNGLIRLLFVGRLEEAKDPLTLLRAFALIVNKSGRRDLRLTLAGDGSLEAECREYIARNGLSEYISMPGWVTNTASCYTDHQIFCLSSFHEAFGICLLEAGFYGLPAVATRVGGVPEVIADGATGFLVPARDPQAMARAILRLADDPEQRTKMGDAARKRVTEQFTAAKMTAAYRRIYNGEL